MKSSARRGPRGGSKGSMALASVLEAARRPASGRGGAAPGGEPEETAPLSVVEPVRPPITISPKARAKARARRRARRMPVDKILKESQHWLDIIRKGHRLTPGQKQRVIKETVKSFSTYFNSGFLAYRKSVAEADQYASIEWTGEGTLIEDITGRQYIDCLGGFGIYSAGCRARSCSTPCAAPWPSCSARSPPATCRSASLSTTAPTRSRAP
jgi:hypothetical protein